MINPDIAFKRKLGTLSHSPLNQCMQCGTCSAVCSLAPADRPFPRKEMIWASWGLKDRLVGNVDVWLCHQCGDCSRTCPRDVKPASVVAAVRQETYLHYVRPRLLGRMVNEPALLPLALGIPVVVITAILLLAGTFRIPEGPVDYSSFFPHAWLNGSFSALTLLFWSFSFAGLGAFWRDMKRNHPMQADAGSRPLLQSLAGVAGEVLVHSRFGSCGSNRLRRLAHMGLFFGFGLLLLVTLYAIWASITGNYPLSPGNPFKLAGNLASLMIYAGAGTMLVLRMVRKDLYGRSNYSDWLLLVAILLLTATGTLVQLARLGDWGLAYHLYFLHLVLVWFVIMYLPFTKLGHVLYRSLALVYARSIGRR